MDRKLLLLFLVFLTMNAHSQVLNDTIDEVTVSGKYIPANVIAATPTQSFTHEQLKRLGARDIGDALKHFAGVQVKDFGGIGGLKTISVRSMGAQHTGVCYDGVPIGDCQSGQIDLSRFTIDNISTVYLTIGQQDDIYTSAREYASAATLHINTMASSSLLKAHLSAGSFGYFSPSVNLNKQVGRWLLSAYVEHLRANGDYPFKLWNGNHLINEKRNNSEINSWRGELNAKGSIGKGQDISMKLYAYNSRRGLPGAVIYDNTFAAERLTDKNFFSQISYENRFGNKTRLKAAAKWNYSWMRDENTDAGGNHENKFRQRETYLTATFWHQPITNLEFSVAQDYTHNYLSTTLPSCPYPSRDTWLTALAMRYNNRRVVMNVSLLHSFIHEQVETGVAAANKRRLSPALSLQWKPFNKSLHLRFSYKDIFRSPTLNDLYYTLVGNVNLRPEKTRQWNVGVTWSCQQKNSSFALTADGYHARVEDKIVAIPTMFIWKMMNVSKVRTWGADITMKADWTWQKNLQTMLTCSYHYMAAKDRTSQESTLYGHQIAYTPRHAGSCNITVFTPIADLSYNLLLTGERYSLGYNSPENRMAGFADHSLSISKTVHLKGTELHVQGDIQNIGNKNYEVVRFYPMQGRNYRISLNYKF